MADVEKGIHVDCMPSMLDIVRSSWCPDLQRVTYAATVVSIGSLIIVKIIIKASIATAVAFGEASNDGSFLLLPWSVPTVGT